MDKICGIYKITSPKNKIYIGSSVDILNNRVRTYKNTKGLKGQPLLSGSINKYGWENHIFEIIEECAEEDLNCRERYWQEFYDVINIGLNCLLVECDNLKRSWSEERKETYKGEGNPFYGKQHTEETKQIYRDRKGELSPRFGVKHTEETKIKIKANITKKSKCDKPNARRIISLYHNIEFECVDAVSEILCIGKSTVIVYMKGNKLKNKYLLMYMDDYDRYKENIYVENNILSTLQLDLNDKDYIEMVKFLKQKKLMW